MGALPGIELVGCGGEPDLGGVCMNLGEFVGSPGCGGAADSGAEAAERACSGSMAAIWWQREGRDEHDAIGGTQHRLSTAMFLHRVNSFLDYAIRIEKQTSRRDRENGSVGD